MAKAGDIVTVEMTSNSPLRTNVDPIFSIAGNTLSNSNEGESVTRMSNTIYKATYTMKDDADDNAYDDPNLTIPIVISNYQDAAGNIGNACLLYTSDAADE